MGSAAFDIQRSAERIALFGDLDALSSCELQHALDDLDCCGLTVDLGGLAFIDSSGIRTLLAARRTHPQLRIVNPTEHHVDLFGVLGISELLLADPAI